MPDLIGEDWKQELPEPVDLDWEDISHQVSKETLPEKEELGEDEEATKVRLTHEPTGMNAIADEYKTRSENEELARDRMVEKIRERLEAEEEQREEERMDYMDMEEDHGRPGRSPSPGPGGGMPGGDEEPPPEPDQPPEGPPDPRR